MIVSNNSSSFIICFTYSHGGFNYAGFEVLFIKAQNKATHKIMCGTVGPTFY